MTTLLPTTVLLALTLGAAPPDLPGTMQELTHAEVVRGGFEQAKQVKGFKKPLVSKGDFIIARGHGVKWHTKTPFESLLTVRKDDISSKQGDTEVFRLDASKEPTVRVINSVLFAMLAGDVDVLHGQFDVQAEPATKGWRVKLTPKQKGLAQVLASIALEGDRFVRRIELTEPSGDGTVIRVLDPTDGPPLTSAEQAGW
jgi:outer membrane lipoprotein-sorting protein